MAEEFFQRPAMIGAPGCHGRRPPEPATAGIFVGSKPQRGMGPDEIGMCIDEVERVLEFAPVLGETQGLAGQATEFLAQGQVISFDVGRVDAAFAAVGPTQGCGFSLHAIGLAEDHAAGHFHDTAVLPVLLHLRIAQGGRRHSLRIPRPASSAGRTRMVPHPKEFEEDVRVVPEGVGGEQRQRAIQAPPDAPQQAPRTIEGPIPHNGRQP